MHTYLISHAPPALGAPEPLTTCVSPTPLPMAAVVAAAYTRLPVQVVRIDERLLDFPALASDPGVAIEQVRQRYAGCARCHLSESRNQIVHFRGNPNAAVAVVGEGPGKDEDVHGVPFIGRSGKLQNELFRESGIDPDKDIAWINLVGCRPCDSRHDADRAPKLVEMSACSERVTLLLRAIRPRVVICFGNEPAALFFDEPPPHNTWHQFPAPDGTTITVGVARHPAYLTRVIGIPNNYKEYFGARLFCGELLAMLPTLTKVAAWPFSPRYLAGITQPLVGSAQ